MGPSFWAKVEHRHPDATHQAVQSSLLDLESCRKGSKGWLGSSIKMVMLYLCPEEGLEAVSLYCMPWSPRDLGTLAP